MSPVRTWGFVLATAVALCAMGPLAPGVFAAPSATQSAADSVKLESALKRFDAAQRRSLQTQARVKQVSAGLDRIVEEQRVTQARLNSRASFMYRSRDANLISVLLGASTFQEFASRWDLLVRLGKEDARDLLRLAQLRVDAQRSAISILGLQSKQAQAAEELQQEAARARKDLASSKAALAAYRARTSPALRQSTPTAPKRKPKPSDPTQQLHGSGAWKTAVASHYGRNFTGRGASGERIGPYSMMVAHKTLPFGTLIEFEYGGKRAVARVADRGPFTAGRTFDLGPGVVRVLGFSGVHTVRYRIIGR